MGRPSKKAERTEEIFQAFQRCVALYGLEGSTLERIAEESGLQRSLVRHYAGNRAELIAELTQRAIEQSNQEWQTLRRYLPAKNVSHTLLEMLFDYESSSDTSLIFQALLFSANQDDSLKQTLQEWAGQNVTILSDILKTDFPDADAETLHSVAFGVVSLYFNLDSMRPLGLIADYRRPAKQAAQQLIKSLQTK